MGQTSEVSLSPIQAVGACIVALLMVVGLTDFGLWILGGLITGAILGALVAGFTKEIVALPMMSGAGAVIGLILHVVFRLIIWIG